MRQQGRGIWQYTSRLDFCKPCVLDQQTAKIFSRMHARIHIPFWPSGKI